MKLPLFIKQETEQIRARLAPQNADINTLLTQQAIYHKKAVQLQGTVTSVASIDESDQETVGTWFMNFPTTVKMTASSTYFYLKSPTGQEILVKYPADLDVSEQDNISLVGIFNAHGVSVESKGFLGTKNEQVLNAAGEPFIGAAIVENQSKQKLEYLRLPT